MFDEYPEPPRVLPDVPEGDTPSSSPGATRFQSCRWRKSGADMTPHCTHRDVLPLAGTTSFNPDAWCPDCVHYKLRRSPRKSPYA